MRRGCKSLTMKGRASHVGPESCVAGREARDEALTGARVGEVLSRESSLVRDADAVCGAEGNTAGCDNASALLVPRGLRPWHASETSCPGTGRSQAWPVPDDDGLVADQDLLDDEADDP
jgi:RNA-directed DNA polymerase